MLKVKVLSNFQDKYTGELHTKGSSFECSEKRFNEILQVGKFVELIKKVEEPVEEKVEEHVEKPVEEKIEKKSRRKKG